MGCRKSLLAIFFLIDLTTEGGSAIKRNLEPKESGYKCKTCKRIVMSLEGFLKKTKSHSQSAREMGKLEEQIQEEFEKLCTYSNVFFDHTYRKAVMFNSPIGEVGSNSFTSAV